MDTPQSDIEQMFAVFSNGKTCGVWPVQIEIKRPGMATI